MVAPNEIDQVDLSLSHDTLHIKMPRGQNTLKYALLVVASRYKQVKVVAGTLGIIYKRSLLELPDLLQVDHGREYTGVVNKLQTKLSVRRCPPGSGYCGAIQQNPDGATLWAPIRQGDAVVVRCEAK